MRTAILTLVVLLVVALVASGHMYGSVQTEPATRPSDSEAALLAVLAVERQSQAYYRAVLDQHRPFHPFGMIYRSEQRHEQRLIEQFGRLGISVPANGTKTAIPAVPNERVAALAAAVQLEKATVAAYDRAIEQTQDESLRETLLQLRTESADHEKWFAEPDTCPLGGRGRGWRRGSK